jgi:hypothetical protein
MSKRSKGLCTVCAKPREQCTALTTEAAGFCNTCGHVHTESQPCDLDTTQGRHA